MNFREFKKRLDEMGDFYDALPVVAHDWMHGDYEVENVRVDDQIAGHGLMIWLSEGGS